jgi:hypothetical protein
MEKPLRRVGELDLWMPGKALQNVLPDGLLSGPTPAGFAEIANRQ